MKNSFVDKTGNIARHALLRIGYKGAFLLIVGISVVVASVLFFGLQSLTHKKFAFQGMQSHAACPKGYYVSGYGICSRRNPPPVPTPTPVPKPTPAPTPTPIPPVGPDVAPIGNLEGITCQDGIYGWGYDTNVPSGQLPVHVYENGVFILGFSTDVYRPDVNAAFGLSGNHGFKADLPPQLRDGRPHSLAVFVINDNASGTHVNLPQKTIVCPSQTASSTKGALEHVSIAWIEGWACMANNPSSSVNVEAFATNTSGDGTKVIDGSQVMYRIATGVANSRRPGKTSECSGNGMKGVRMPTPQSVLDRADHVIRLATTTATGARVFLSGSISFNSQVIYSQEPIDNIDDHLLINHGFITPEAQADYQFNIYSHTNIAAFPPAGNVVFSGAVSCDASWATGLNSTAAGQRGLPGSCATQRNPHMVVQTSGDKLGLLLDSNDFGVYNTGVFVQSNWKNAQRVFRQGSDSDRVRVSGIFKQPLEFPDSTTSPDAMSFWYYVLHFKQTGHRPIWVTVPVYNSRVAYNAPWADLSNGISQLVYGDANDLYINSPLAATSTWITPCSDTSFFSHEPYGGERKFCFEMSARQFRLGLQSLATQFPGVDTNPADFSLDFFLVNTEAWGIGAPGRLGLSMHNLEVVSLY